MAGSSRRAGWSTHVKIETEHNIGASSSDVALVVSEDSYHSFLALGPYSLVSH